VTLLDRVVLPLRALTVAALISVIAGAGVAWKLADTRHAALPTIAQASSKHLSLSRLPLAARGPFSAALGAGTGAYRVHAAGAGLDVANPAQHLRARFGRDGVKIGAGKLQMSLRTQSVGYGRTQRELGTVDPRGSQNRVSYSRGGGLREWYANGPLGVEQGFTLARAPSLAHGGLLTLTMAVAGNARASLSTRSDSVVFRQGNSEISYGGLLATDARGQVLPSRLALDRGVLQIRVNTRGARYPVRIDPLVQQGPKLTGKDQSGGSNLGQSVAISADGNTALVGGPSDEEGGEMLVGAAWVFTRSGSTWTQQGPKLRGAGRVGEGQFGISVALSADGNTALIGGINDANVGAAWVFTRSGSTWTQQGPKLTGGGEETGNGRFGKSVALSADGNTALVGAYFDNGDTGGAFAFKRSGATWSHEGKKITGAGEEGMAQFGLSVALSTDGKTALIGGPGDEGSTKEPAAGAAWVFVNGGAGWAAQGPKLTGGGAKGAGELGTSVALSAEGSTALVGAPADGSAGGVRVFTRSGSSWAQQGGELQPSDAVGGAAFGTAVALSASGSVALIGGPVDEDGPKGMLGPNPSGAAWEFARSGATWAQQGPKVLGTTSESEFGAAVALSPDARTALIGGPIDSTGGVTDAGALWVYVNPPASPLPLTTEALPKAPASPTVASKPATPPVLTNVSQSHARWRAGSSLARLSATGPKKKPKPPIGTTFSFTLNVAANVGFTFSQKVAGRRVRGKCVAAGAGNRHKPSCKRTLVRGEATVVAHAGNDKLAFQGVLARQTKLKPGSYTVTLVAASAALRSAPHSLSFTIVK
jgi:FG-GAP repeat